MTQNELKTLNDFVGFDTEGNLGIGKKYIDREELKAEAIKWIQEDIEEGDKNDVADLIIKWQKRFNLIIDEASNITKENLI